MQTVIKFDSERPWIALFSQTGSEIVEVSKRLKRKPDLIITNKRPDHLRTINEELEGKVFFVSNTPSVEELQKVLSTYDNPLITLHGWLRILPEEICNSYEIYNGHPGLVSKFPELKGKDPQMRTWNGGYDIAGCVIHRVTAEVDEGEILAEKEISVRLLNLNELFHRLHNISVELWIEFLKGKL